MVKKMMLLAAAGAMILSGCARKMDSNHYVSSDSMGIVIEGTVLSARPVTIKESDRLQDNGVGALGGAVAGGVAGNSVGGGSGRTAATVGGALAGAVIGALIQDALNESQGMEYIVKVNQKNKAAGTAGREDISIGGNSVASKMRNSIDTSMSSDTISVVQGTDVVFAVGQPVYVVYNNNKARLIAR